MSGDDNPKKEKRGKLRLALSVIPLAALTYIAITMIFGNGSGLRWLQGVFSSRKAYQAVEEYDFDVGRRRAFADLGGAVAAIGTLGVQVVDQNGAERLRDPYRMSEPAICAAKGKAVVFDIGGTAVRIISGEEAIAAFETESAIVSASINDNGWTCICVQEAGGYKGLVTVRDSTCEDAYKVHVASGYVLSAVLSNDNKNLAVLILTDSGCRIVRYKIDSENPTNTFDLPRGLILDIRFVSGGGILAVTTDSLVVVNEKGEMKELYGFHGKRLGGYSFFDGVMALYLLDYGVGFDGRLTAVDENGRSLGEIATDREIVSISLGKENLAVLWNDRVTFFYYELNEAPQTDIPADVAGATRIIMLGADSALAAGDHSAIRFNIRRMR